MDRDGISLADEVKAALTEDAEAAPKSPGAIGAARVGAARGRFLPYVVAGAAVLCGLMAGLVGGQEYLFPVFLSAITAGFLAGLTIGWALLSGYRRYVARSAAGGRRVDIAMVALTVPAYAVAGWASAWAGWLVAVALASPIPEPGLPDAWGLLIYAAVVIYPLSYVFARRDHHRPQDFVGALLAGGEILEKPRSWSIVAAFIVVVAWLIGALFAVFGLAIGVQVLFADQLEATPIAPLLGLAGLVLWVGLTVGGSAWTLRRTH